MTSVQEATLCDWLEGRRSTGGCVYICGIWHSLFSVASNCRLGFEYRKPKALPKVADVEEQAKFIRQYERLLNNLRADEAVYFADAV